MLVVRAVVAVVAALAVAAVQGENIELRSGKQVEFFDDLQKGDSWGVQFQIVEGNIGFRVRAACLGAAPSPFLAEQPGRRHI